MEIRELFEEQNFYNAYVEFGLVITDTFTVGDAADVAHNVAEQSDGELDEYQEYDAATYGEHYADFRIYLPEDNIELPRKTLRRLSRGKPSFELYFYNAYQGGTVTEY